MKNAGLVLVTILVIIGVVFTLVTAGNRSDKTLNSNTDSSKSASSNTDSQKGGNVNSKTYSQAPQELPEADRVGKKARFETSLGNFTVNLEGAKAPKTVSNFITLAKDGFYDNLTFHRIIAGFMIQGGDPKGDGTGGPGYQFADEFDASLTFDQPGVLAMANAGPNTNGSQFFVTVAAYSSGNNHYSIFGKVADGFDIVQKISKVATDSSDKPTTAVIIKKITIL